MIATILLALALAAEPAKVPAPPVPPAKVEPAPPPEPCPVEEKVIPTPPGYKDHFDPPPEPAKLSWRWTTGDTVREGLVLGLIALDWRQTRMFRMDGVQELNPVVGRNPSRARVNTLIAGAMLAHVGVSIVLPHGEWRTSWQVAVGGAEAAAVMNNWRNGCNPFHARCSGY